MMTMTQENKTIADNLNNSTTGLDEILNSQETRGKNEYSGFTKTLCHTINTIILSLTVLFYSACATPTVKPD